MSNFIEANLIGIATLLSAIIGGIVALYQWSKDVSTKRADYLDRLIERTRTDESIRALIYRVEYPGRNRWYNDDFHGSGNLEMEIDQALSYYSYICYLSRNKIIGRKELSYFEYEISRILKDGQVQDYLYNLHHFTKGEKRPFKHLFDYGKSKALFGKEFYDSRAYEWSEKYHSYLNF